MRDSTFWGHIPVQNLMCDSKILVLVSSEKNECQHAYRGRSASARTGAVQSQVKSLFHLNNKQTDSDWKSWS